MFYDMYNYDKMYIVVKTSDKNCEILCSLLLKLNP